MLRSLLTLLLVLLPLAAHAQVRVDDKDVILDSGKSLQQAITDGDLGSGGGGGVGNVVGPVSSTTGAVPRFANTAGTLLLDSTSADSLSLLRQWLTYGDVVDVDPNAVGTTTCGLQEALASTQCGSGTGNCILQLRADTTCSLPARNTWPTGGSEDADCAFETNGADNVWIRGHGPTSVLRFANAHAGETPGDTEFDQMLCVETGSDNITFSDFTLDHEDTCTSGCTLGYGMGIDVRGATNDTTIERMVWDSDQSATTDSTAPNVFFVRMRSLTSPATDNTPRRVVIKNNRTHGANAGTIHWLQCDDCEVVNNHFDVENVLADSSPTGTVRAVGVFGGTGRVADNFINIATDGIADANLRYTSGIVLAMAQTLYTTPQDRMFEGLKVSGNHIVGLRSQINTGILVQGWNDVQITDNLIEGGVCSNDATKACTHFEQCGASGAATCDVSPAKGIWFDGTDIPSGVTAFTGFNITGNTTRNITSPVVFGSFGSGTATTATRNTFSSNVWIGATGDGFSGNPQRLADNLFIGNQVPGSAYCVAGLTQSETCSISQSGIDGATTIESLVPSTHSFPPSFPVTSGLYVFTDDTTPGGCSSDAGPYRSICQWNGTSHVPLNGPQALWYQTVRCAGTTGTHLWNTRATAAPAATCTAGATETTLMRGTADFDDTTDEEIQLEAGIPLSWSALAVNTSTIRLLAHWRAAATTGVVRWCAQTVCRAGGEVDDAIWDANVDCIDDTVAGTTNLINSDGAVITLSGTETDTCAAGERLHLRFYRDADHVNDTMTGDASLISVRVSGIEASR